MTEDNDISTAAVDAAASGGDYVIQTRGLTRYFGSRKVVDMLEEIARENNADLQIYGLHDNVGQFKRHFSYLMSVNRFTRPSSFPSWVWEIFDRYDNETFSPEMLKDLAIEGCVIFTRRS